MAFLFKDWFFRQFPDYHQVEDSYKDVKGEGLLQRYLRTYGVELDEQFMPYIDNFIDLIDTQLTPNKYLPLLAYILGSPPSPDGDPVLYRKILAYIVSIYKVKGTKRSFELFFNLMGLRINLLEDTPKKKITYDSGAIYDKAIPEIYDSECDFCSGYYITYASTSSNPNTFGTVSSTLLSNAERVVYFLQPINAVFKGWIKGITVDDELIPTITESNNLPTPPIP